MCVYIYICMSMIYIYILSICTQKYIILIYKWGSKLRQVGNQPQNSGTILWRAAADLVRRHLLGQRNYRPGNWMENSWTWQFFVTFLGWLSDPFRWLSDLQLGDEKVTWKKLVDMFFLGKSSSWQFFMMTFLGW